jgi:regulatory protein
MTHDDASGDGSALAPVTPLFGVRGVGSGRPPVSGDVARGPVEGETQGERRTSPAPTPGDASSEPDDDVELDPATGWAVSAETPSAASARREAGQPVPTDSDGDRSDDGVATVAADPVAEAAEQLAAISAHWSAPGDDDAEPAPSTPRTSRGRLRVVEPVVATGSDDEPTEPEPEDLEAQRRRAENVSLHALSRRGVSSAEMTRLLRDRDLDEEVVLGEVARLEGVGLLNDRELAENLVRSKQERKGLGRGAVTSELRQRGLDASVVEEALADIDDDDEQSRADEWARKRVGSLRGLDHATAERRLNGYLMRRGYRSDVVRRAIEQVLPRGGSSRGGGVRFE